MTLMEFGSWLLGFCCLFIIPIAIPVFLFIKMVETIDEVDKDDSANNKKKND